MMNDSFNLNHDLEPHIQNLLNDMHKNLIDCGADLGKLRAFYKKYISNMSPEFVMAVKQEFVVANFFNRKIGGSIPYIKTLNELIHDDSSNINNYILVFIFGALPHTPLLLLV